MQSIIDILSNLAIDVCSAYFFPDVCADNFINYLAMFVEFNKQFLLQFLRSFGDRLGVLVDPLVHLSFACRLEICFSGKFYCSLQ